jgi:uncharacterized protein YxeA
MIVSIILFALLISMFCPSFSAARVKTSTCNTHLEQEKAKEKSEKSSKDGTQVAGDLSLQQTTL